MDIATQHLLKNFGKLLRLKDNFSDAFTAGQIDSKSWLVSELHKIKPDLGIVYVLCGWVGVLSNMLLSNDKFTITHIRSFDIDARCLDAAEALNHNFVIQKWKFKPVLGNIMSLNYIDDTYHVRRSDGTIIPLSDSVDTIINCSCEHLSNFNDWWDILPSNKLIVLQSNNLIGADGHVNCVKSLKEFMNMAPMRYEFSGELDLGEYKRFMLIGYKTSDDSYSDLNFSTR